MTSPYHDWIQGLWGKLISVLRKAHEFPDFDTSRNGLKKAVIDLSRGMLRVRPRPTSGSIMD